MRASPTAYSLVLLALSVSNLCLSTSDAQDAVRRVVSDKTPAPVVASSAAHQAPPALILPDPPTPVRQAQEIGLGQCASVLGMMSHDALTAPYDVQSGWSRSDPPHHVFQSVAAIRNPANDPPDGVAALIAAPLGGGGCDGVIVQVFPLAGDCQSAQRVMLRTGKLLAPMMGTRIMLDAKGNRVLLLPAFAHTCIAISIDTRFGGDNASVAPK